MRNAGLEEAQAGIKIAGRNINNLRYADDSTLMAESEELPKSSAAASICSHGHQYPQANTRLAYLASTPSFFSLRALDGTINSRIPLKK